MQRSFLGAVLIAVFFAAMLFTSGSARFLNEPVMETEKVGMSSSEEPADYDDLLQDALDMLRDRWEELAKEDAYMTEPYVDIRDTRLIKICKNPVLKSNEGEKTLEELSSIEYIVEFLHYSNYMSENYPTYVGLYNSVVVYKDGTMEVPSKNPLSLIQARYYISDYSGIIEEIINLGDSCSGLLFP